MSRLALAKVLFIILVARIASGVNMKLFVKLRYLQSCEAQMFIELKFNCD